MAAPAVLADQMLQNRSTRLAQGKDALLENLFWIDTCCQEYSAFIDQLVMRLTNHKNVILSQLQSERSKLKTKIWEAITEVQSSLSEEFPDLQKSLSVALIGGDLGRLRLFQYHVDRESIGQAVEHILQYTVSECSEVKLIAVQEKDVKFFDVAKEQWQGLFTLQEKVMVDFSSAFALIGGMKVLVCGGGLSRNECCIGYIGSHASILEVQSINQRSNMLVPRNSHGIVYDSSRYAVYVFGGQSAQRSKSYLEHLQSCETFRLSSMGWEALPDMHEKRCGLNPCMYSDLVYLCGGFSSTVEVYNPATNSFALLSDFSLPKQSQLSPSTALIDSDYLIVISRNVIVKWHFQEKQLLFSRQHPEYEQGDRKYLCPWSNSLPLVCNGVCYITDLFKQACRGISLASGSVVKEVSLT